MPKRRMTSKRRAQIRLWQLASVKARGKAVVPEWGSYSDPHLGREKLGWSYRKQRTIKYMGKSALKHSGGVNENRPMGSVTVAPWAQDVLAGKKSTHSPLMPHPSTLRGDMVAKGGSAYRMPRPKSSPAKSVAPKPNSQTVVGQKHIAMAKAQGMSVAELKKKMASDSKKMTAELKKQNGLKVNPYKKKHGPGKGH